MGDGGDPYSGYDRFGRTVDMRWLKILSAESVQSVDRIHYGYDRMNRRLWRQDLAAPAETQQDRFYGYDGLGQVKNSSLGNLNINRTAIAGVPAEKEAFDYDSIGNWQHYLRQAEGVTTLDQTRWNNRDNQLTALNADASGLAYDAAENMTACRPDKDGDWTKGYTMVWDAWNRLVEVKDAATNDTIVTHAYDGLTRRTLSAISDLPSPVLRHFYYNSVWKCVEERLNSSTDPDRVYYWSGRAGHRDELLRRDRTTSSVLGETLWCLMDYFDPIAITNSSGGVQERYSYSAFGLASILTPGFESRASSDYAWNFLFHGQFRDVETGWDNYGYRYYLPWLGRWPSRDPIAEIGSLNVYGLESNDPVNKIDFLGLVDRPSLLSMHRKRNQNNHCPFEKPGCNDKVCLKPGAQVKDLKGNNWTKEGANSYHGSNECYRGTGKLSGSQCCYDKDCKLANKDRYQGTFDYSPPYDDKGKVRPLGVIGHFFKDVVPHWFDSKYEPTPDENIYR